MDLFMRWVNLLAARRHRLTAKQMNDEMDKSRELFKQSLDQAKNIRMREGVMEAQAALRRVDRNSKRLVNPLDTASAGDSTA